MYLPLLVVHSCLRWIALALLLYSIYRAFGGYIANGKFLGSDNALRHWTATVLQVQMTIGLILYFNSPFVSAYMNNVSDEAESSFFALVHSGLMFTAVVIISIGSAMAKRQPTDQQKYKTMLVWFCIGLLIILVAIPWPFSPLAQRPYFRIS
jgi:hypothetical protein